MFDGLDDYTWKHTYINTAVLYKGVAGKWLSMEQLRGSGVAKRNKTEPTEQESDIAWKYLERFITGNYGAR